MLQDELFARGVVKETLDELLVWASAQCGASSPGSSFETSLLEILHSCPVPVEVVRSLWRVAQERPLPSALYLERGWLRLALLMRQGSYVCRVLAQSPEMIDEILGQEQDHKEPRHELASELTQRLLLAVAQDPGVVLSVLRRFKQRESLRLFLLEVEGRHSVRETTAGIADLAQACLQVALIEAGKAVDAPEIAAKIAILGMGKLGGRELNYSSDVDLIVLCDDLIFAQPEERVIAETITRKMIALMEEVTAEGYVFRVDLRLRPEGARGLLVQCPDAMVDYYLSWGRTWERSAMLKARHVAGEEALSEKLLKALEPFLYRKHLDFQVIDELRAMKEMINGSAKLSAVMGVGQVAAAAPSLQAPQSLPSSPARRAGSAQGSSSAAGGKGRGLGLMARLKQGHPVRDRSSEPPTQQPVKPVASATEPINQLEGSRGWDVKIGVGGIREIEFFVQALQLVHCGTRTQLRVRNTLEALDRLLYSGLLSDEDHGVLADAYDFLRRVEHRIQMEQDRQTHRIPEDALSYEHLASRLGHSVESFHQEVMTHRRHVWAIFERLFTESAQQAQEPTLPESRSDTLELVLGANAQTVLSEQVINALAKAGFVRPRQVAGQLRVLMEKDYGPYGPRATPRERRLGQYLLSISRSSADPVRAFGFITRLITTVGDRPWFWRMLGDNPHATQLLVHVFGSSDYLGGMLMRDPNMVQRLMGASTAQLELPAEALHLELEELLAGVEDPSHRRWRVHRFYQEQILRLALHAIAGALSIEQATSQLTAVAEVVIDAVLREVYAQLRLKDARHPEYEALPFSVLGMGKLGGGELGFGSDLDVVFVYEPVPALGLDHAFYARLAQRLVRQLSSVSEEGRLYEVDARLRPGGQKGTLVVSLEAFESYYQESASGWERQALLRARPVSGPPGLVLALLKLRHEQLFGARVDASQREQMSLMRARMIEHQAPTRGVDIKTSPGGIIDVEFVVQWLQWSLASYLWSDPDARGFMTGPQSQHTCQALRALAEQPAFSRAYDWLEVDALVDDYLMLRRVEAILRVESGRSAGALPSGADDLRALARRLGFSGEGAAAQLEATLSRLMERVRLVRERVLDRVVGSSG